LREVFPAKDTDGVAAQTALFGILHLLSTPGRSTVLLCRLRAGRRRHLVDQEFWAGTTVRTNFLCNLGHGDASKLFARHPRLGFDESCRLL
jgi:3-hydroxypropanoate dehydrogenase